MSPEAFLEIVSRKASAYAMSRENYSTKFRSIGVKAMPTMENYLHGEWNIGGSTGGDSPRFEPGDPPGDIDSLDAILEEICPDISFLRYKNLIKEVVVSETYSVNGYYGDSSEYIRKYCNLQTLYNALAERKLL